MTPADLAALVQSAVRAALDAGDLTGEVPADVVVERPRSAEHGDYTTNVAMRLAKPAGRPPREVAELLAGRLRAADGVARVDVAGPGFLNITLDAGTLGAVARQIVDAGARYGRSDELAGQRINLEFVSANPTGPVHLGHTRWAALGDSLHRLLEAAGAQVTAEHYINDFGSQIEKFGASLYAAAQGRDVPDDGYHGDYVPEVAEQIVRADPGVLELPADDALAVFSSRGEQLMVQALRESLARFRVDFDVWFSERTLYETGAVDAALDRLREQGHVYDADGAIWLRTTDFADDKDRVLVRSNGEKTYFASDAAYYLDKRSRGFERCVYMLGADHHGYVNRLKAIVACAGDDPEQTIEVLIGQLVKLVRDGEEVRMSKRAGNIVTLGEFVDLVGVDAGRYSLARWSADTPLTLDIGEITKKSADNPVYYVQYAHARTCNAKRNAGEVGITLGVFAPELLTDPHEAALLTALGEFPRVVATAAELRAPHRVARYLEELAGTYHRWYDTCRIIPKGDEPITDVNRTRVWVNEATRVVLANGLDLLGVSAPERM
ncbi:arginine--tRNA ligase [uncultured Jatrophihabitans sp.]|uniref:arginine--tRNA ligase n=1 Tax=uncultured Jatrophihabitans sp. TaxID=1610747 RepID=UPI0035CB6D87